MCICITFFVYCLVKELEYALKEMRGELLKSKFYFIPNIYVYVCICVFHVACNTTVLDFCNTTTM